MASLRDLRQKIKSVKSTQQITKSMKMVAAARLNRAQLRALSARPFYQKMAELLHGLSYLAHHAEGEEIFNHPFLKERTGNRLDLVVVTSDRGLCGGFNTHLIRHTLQLVRSHANDDVHLWVVGKKGRDFFRRTHLKVEKEYVGFFQRLGYQQAAVLSADLINCFLHTPTRGIKVISNQFKSRISQELVERTLLPIEEIPALAPSQDFLYEPSKGEILNELLPRYIEGQIYEILVESEAAELAARMTAMDSATKNAGEMIDSLTLLMNKIRQASITKEISEIVGGAEALQTA